MQYDSYRDKVKKVSAFLSRMYAHMTLIILSLVAIALVVAAIVVTKGLMLTQSVCPETVTYGDTLDYSARFLFSRSLYEYREEGSSRWSSEVPVTPGTYAVRASGKTSFGSRNYTEPHTFTIVPREITVTVADSAVTYGEIPRTTANLVAGDTLHCDVSFLRYAPVTEAWVDPLTITITDRAGNDRTNCYTVLDTPRTSIRLTPRPLTVTVQDASKVYDHLYLSFDGYEITQGTLFGADTLTAVFYDSIRDAGSTSNTPTLCVLSEAGEDMTELYDLKVQSGTLTVEQRPLILKTGSVTYVYSGHEMEWREYEIDPSTPPVTGHVTEVRSAPTILDCGSMPNALTFSVYGSDGEDVTRNYAIFVEAGTLAVSPRQVVLTTESASLVYDGTDQSYPYGTVENGVGDEYRVIHASTLRDVGKVENRMNVEFYRGDKNITDNYTVVGYNYGTLEITPRPLYIRMDNAEKVYDGTPLTSSAFSILGSYPLAEGHTATLEGDASVLFGVVPNICKKGTLVIQDQWGADVTANYDVDVTAGILIVHPRPITVTLADDSKVYDDTPLQNESWEITEGSILEGHDLRMTFIPHTDTDVGTYPNGVYSDKTRVVDTATNTDVTMYYSISYIDGTLTILHRPITLSTKSDQWMYDGTLHKGSTQLILKEGSKVASHTLIPVGETGITNAGRTPNRVEATVMSSHGDVTHNYDIQYEYGTLTVTKRPITVSFDSLTYTYDGKPHEVSVPTLSATTPNRLVAGHSLSIKPSDILSYTDAGTYDNVATVSVYNALKDTYETENYEISVLAGSITINTRPLTIQINGEKIYDGKPLGEWRVDSVGKTPPVQGHTLSASPKEVPTDAGTMESVLDSSSVSIRDANGNSVIRNYSITWKRGVLTVKPRPVALKTASAEKIYDGTPLAAPAVTFTSENSALNPLEGDVVYVWVYGSGTNVGYYPNSADPDTFTVRRDGVDVTANYELVKITEGTLTVRYDTVLEICTGSAAKDYDGLPLFCDEYTVEVISGTLPIGCIVYVDVKGSITRPGTVENTATVTVWDQNGNDVTEFMTVQFRFGELTVRALAEDDTSLGRVMTDYNGTLYLRMMSFGDYNGQGFVTAPTYGSTVNGYSLNYLPSAVLQSLGISDRYTAQFESMADFMLPYYMEIGGIGPVVRSDTVYTSSVGSDYSVTFYNTANTFALLELFHEVPDNMKPYLLGNYSAAEQRYSGFVYDHYLSIDQETLTYMEEVIRTQGFSASDASIIKDVALYVRHAAEYSLYYDPELDNSSNVAVAFLRDYKEGKCTHYATAATMLYRALGIPARYVVGFTVEGKAGEWVDITQPGHAWVEVYIDYLGWVPVEVTGSAGGSTGPSVPTDPSDPTDPPELEKPTLELTPAFRSKVYDGEYLYSPDELMLTPELEFLLENGYTYTVKTSGSIREIGDGASYVTEFHLYDPDGTEVTTSFDLVKKQGLLRITPIAVEVFLYPVVKTIDGRPAVWSEGDYQIMTLPDGVTLSLTVTLPAYSIGYVSLTELNLHGDSYVSYRITRGGRDVTEQYTVIFTIPEGMADTPVLEVRTRSIEVTAASETRVYDGTDLTNSTVYISKGSLISGHTLVATATGVCSSVGSASNSVGSVVILDQNGKDVTGLYTVTRIKGTLTLLEPMED